MGKTVKELILTVFEKCAGASGCEVCRLHMEDEASFTRTLHFLKPISVFQRLLPKSVNYFCGDMKDALISMIFFYKLFA